MVESRVKDAGGLPKGIWPCCLQLAGKPGYLGNILISSIKDSDLEKWIEELETQLGRGHELAQPIGKDRE